MHYSLNMVCPTKTHSEIYSSWPWDCWNHWDIWYPGNFSSYSSYKSALRGEQLALRHLFFLCFCLCPLPFCLLPGVGATCSPGQNLDGFSSVTPLFSALSCDIHPRSFCVPLSEKKTQSYAINVKMSTITCSLAIKALCFQWHES